MQLLRGATLKVRDLGAAVARYRDWLGYRVVDEGRVSAALAQSWGAPLEAGRPFAVMAPESGATVYLRFIEGAPHLDYLPLRSYGWAAVEITVADVAAVHARMQQSPFVVIGPPKALDGMPKIIAMQVVGPDDEILYFTEIGEAPPGLKLPQAESLVDRFFIAVLAASHLDGALGFARERLGLATTPPSPITYTMIAKAHGLPVDHKHRIAMGTHDGHAFLELDQYPPTATARPQKRHELPSGVAMVSFLAPNFDARMEAGVEHLIAPPTEYPGPVYAGRRAATFKGPDGTLFELIET